MVDHDTAYKAVIERFMAATPPPWEGHPEDCKWHPRPLLITCYRRRWPFGRKVHGGNCAGCGWRVEGTQWDRLVMWEREARDAVLGRSEPPSNGRAPSWLDSDEAAAMGQADLDRMEVEGDR